MGVRGFEPLTFAVKERIHSLTIGVLSWAVDHNDACPGPAPVNQSGLAEHVDSWPENPYTGSPMAQGIGPGDFSYTLGPDGRTYQLVGLDYDRQGHLVWTNDTTRRWVASVARSSQAAPASRRDAAQHRMSRWAKGNKPPWPLTPRARHEARDSGVRGETDEAIWHRSTVC